MSGKCVKVIEFYKSIPGAKGRESHFKHLGKQIFDQNNVPLAIKLPEGCDDFECYSIITDEMLVDGKMVDMESEKLNFHDYDFSIAKREDCDGLTAAVCLKCLPVYEIYNVVDVQTIHNIGYDDATHADCVGDFRHIQHPKDLSLDCVVVKNDCNRFELFDSVTETLNTSRGDVKLTSKQKINHSVFYVGYLEEVQGKSKTVVARARDGQRIVCRLGELIDPSYINKFGRIQPSSASPDM